MKNIFKKMLVASVTASSLLIFAPPPFSATVSTVQAEIKTYTGIGDCVRGDLMTEAQSKKHARDKAELDAKEQAGVYLRGYSKQNNFNLTENKIEVITNSIVNFVGEPQYKTESMMWGNSPAIKYVVTIQANIDTDGINAYIKNANESNIKSSQKDIKDNLNKIDKLNEQYNSSTSKDEKDKIRAEFNEADKKVLAGQKLTEGNEFYTKGDYQKAIELYNESLKLNPNGTAYYNLGLVYLYKMNQYDLAIENLNQANKFYQGERYADLYGVLGQAYYCLGQYEKAVWNYGLAIEECQYLAYTWYKYSKGQEKAYRGLCIELINRADAYLAWQKYDMAIADYQRSLNTSYVNDNQLRAQAYTGCGLAYQLMGNYDEAISNFNMALERDPNYVDAYFQRGYIYEQLKNNEQAIADYSKAIELNPNYDMAYNNRGWSYYNLKQYDKALEDFNKALELNPNNEYAKANRELCYQAMKKNKKKSRR